MRADRVIGVGSQGLARSIEAGSVKKYGPASKGIEQASKGVGLGGESFRGRRQAVSTPPESGHESTFSTSVTQSRISSIDAQSLNC